MQDSSPEIIVTDPTGEPTDAAVSALAALLLSLVDQDEDA